MKISVIIPALNEEARIRDTIQAIYGHYLAIGGKGRCSPEIIVSDGGSRDSTREVAKSLGAIVLEGPAGRGPQMDLGASKATGEVLLFLHADTRLPRGWVGALTMAFEEKNAVGGGFCLSIDSGKKTFRIIELVVKFRSRFLGVLYGDQAIFVRREEFFKAGGYGDLPLMEDVDLIKRLKRLGRVVLLNERVTTSSRRWDGKGVLKNTLWNLLILSLFSIGVAPRRLYGLYYRGSVCD